MIKIIALGKIKEEYLQKLIEDYTKRITKYHRIQLIELKDTNNLTTESLAIQKHLNPSELIITLEIEGTQMSSEEFANLIEKSFISHSTITFIIGSSEGLDDSIKSLANIHLSFSKFTYPHGLMRGILLEQIYRALKINNNETYHK